jgi:hypothetical protein
MAVPRINRVYGYGEDPDIPASGPSWGGAEVAITGANFLTPSRGGSPTRSVGVLFGAAAAPRVRVLRGNLLHVTSPPTPFGLPEHGQGLVSITVRNLDADGVPIPGETATRTGAYRYVLPSLDSRVDQALTEVERALLIFLSTRICANSLATQSVEYDDVELAIAPDIARLPALVIQGPQVTDPAFPREFQVLPAGRIEDPEGRSQVLRNGVQFDLLYRVTGQAPSRAAMLNLMSVTSAGIDRARSLELPTGTARVQMDVTFPNGGRPSADTRPSDSDLHSFTARIRISNIQVVGAQPHQSDDVDVAVPLVSDIRIITVPP